MSLANLQKKILFSCFVLLFCVIFVFQILYSTMVAKASFGDNNGGKVATVLTRLMGDDFCSQNSFENISRTFYLYFSEAETYQIGQTLDFMLRNDDMLPSSYQKATALYLIYDMFKDEPLYLNPFVHVFVNGLDAQNSKALRTFCSQLANVHVKNELSPVFAEMISKTPKLLMFELQNPNIDHMLNITGFLTALC